MKIENVCSDWNVMKCGIQQGSLNGPVLFNVFINDLLCLLNEYCNEYNYADNNTLSFSHKDSYVVKDKLEMSVKIAFKWFEKNGMKANPEKFQAMVLVFLCCP